MKCSKCQREAVYESRYSGTFLCKEHFFESVERRVKSEIRKQIHFQGRTTIAVALSGGKDSSVMLYLLHKILSPRKNTTLIAVTVDEGIDGYREHGLSSGERLCEMLGIERRTISMADTYGVTLDSIVNADRETIPCSYCGPIRRHLLNRIALEVNADYLAVGTNLDDYSQATLMNVVKGDFDRMARMAPHTSERKGLIRRVLPLIKIPEKEVLLYALLARIPYDSSWCPYFRMAQRNTFREIIETLETAFPGSRFAILSFAEKVKALSSAQTKGGNEEIQHCAICGEVSKSDICPSCRKMLRAGIQIQNGTKYLL